MKPDPQLEIGDPFRFFEGQALALRDRLRLPAEFIPEAITILRNAFGERWLREQAKSRARGVAIPTHTHALGTCLAVAGGPQVVHVLELAVYLKRLATVPNIGAVITEMKSVYSHGLLQLAFGYRLIRLGANNLELEPVASGGRKADMGFTWNGRPVLAECYRPRELRTDSMPEMHRLIDPVADAVGRQLRRIRIYLKRSIEPVDRKRLQARIVQAVRESAERDTVEIDDDAAAVSIEGITLRDGDPDYPNPEFAKPEGRFGDADWAVRFTRAKSRELDGIRLGTVNPEGLGRVFVWRPPSETVERPVAERAARLARKLENKLVQMRRDDGPARLLIAAVPEAENRDDDAIRVLTAVHGKLAKGHARMAGILLVRRAWFERQRFGYMGHVLDGDEASSLGSDFVDRLNHLESAEDLLADWR